MSFQYSFLVTLLVIISPNVTQVFNGHGMKNYEDRKIQITIPIVIPLKKNKAKK